ncbi:pyridoxamine 5'-phosphate oxidase family protein [Knoellia sp. CPCC 206453]|uniref:pyridoxamine 5'-phosphate oxidase family protein n=1 Tax=Knoellia pratensis TaxID=3404796 RepID=UPI00360DF05A
MVDKVKRIQALGAAEDWLAILVTQFPGRTPSSSLVNVGLIPHPVTGDTVLAFVSRGGTAKLRNLRAIPQASLVFRSGWDWISAIGAAEIVGPDDPHARIAATEVPGLLRTIYAAAGGTHPDMAAYDREMVEDRRAAVLITPTSFVTNPVPHDRED